MVNISDYGGREQSYVKHTFLQHYLARLVHKTASTFDHIVYVDGFAGPWQSANEQLQDTSFGIALNALRQAKSSWKASRNVRMSAFLVERDPVAYKRLVTIRDRFPDLEIQTFPNDFVSVLPNILNRIPADSFTFFFIDPKGWRIRLHDIEQMLARSNSEVIFNFMFEFINRAASMRDPVVANGLDELIPYGNWREKLREAEDANPTGLSSDERKKILVAAFAESLSRLGHYSYVAETTVLRPLRDRPIYCLFYATRHPKGLEVYRDCQVSALIEQSKARAVSKIQHTQSTSGQGELFSSLHDMGPDELNSHLASEASKAEKAILELTPFEPNSIRYDALWPRLLAQYVVRLTNINQISARLRKEGKMNSPDWEAGRRVPQASYRMQRPT